MQKRPSAIIWFRRVFIARWLIAAGLWLDTYFSVSRNASPGFQAAIKEHPYAIYGPLVGGFIISMAFSGFVLLLVLRQHRAARILIAIWLAVIALNLISIAIKMRLSVTPLALADWATHAMLAICLWLLFRADARTWFAGNWTNPDVVKTFE